MIEQFVLDDIFHTEFFLLNISGKKITQFLSTSELNLNKLALGIRHHSAHPSLTLKCLKINK